MYPPEGKKDEKVLEYDDQTKPVVPKPIAVSPSTLIQNHDESAFRGAGF
jgi:hypothetical protein